MMQKMKKIVLLWSPLFVGAPVRPIMLNMSKSASECDKNPIYWTYTLPRILCNKSIALYYSN